MAQQEEQIIKITVDTNASDAAKDVNQLGGALDKTTTSTAKAAKETATLANASDKSAKATKDQAASFEDLGGGVGDAIGQVKALGKQFLALMANPIVLFIAAIVGSLALLYKAFVSTDAGAEKMEQMMAGVSATIDVLRDRILKVGGAIAKFFSGDFKGALADAKTAVSGIGEEIAREFEAAAKATAILQELEDTMRDLSVSRAKLNRDLVGAREALQDENTSYAEKKRLLAEVTAAEQKQTASEIAASQKKLAAMKALSDQSDISDEQRDEQANLQKTIYGLQEESLRNQIKLNKENARLDREEAARRKAAAEERKRLAEEERKERELRSLELVEEQKRALDLVDDSYDIEQQKKRDHEMAMADINAKARELEFQKEKEAAEAKLKFKKEIQDAELNVASQGIELLKTLAPKSKAIQKGAVIAEGVVAGARIVQSTQAAIMADIAVPLGAGLPKVPFDIASGALSLATTVAATAKALQALGGGSAPSVNGGGAVRPPGAGPSVAFNNTAENQIGQSIGKVNADNPPLKVVVSESDITKAQNNVKILVDKNTI